MTEFAEGYRTDKPNAPIHLCSDPITLREGGQSLDLSVRHSRRIVCTEEAKI
jgi:hypothetical protein